MLPFRDASFMEPEVPTWLGVTCRSFQNQTAQSQYRSRYKKFHVLIFIRLYVLKLKRESSLESIKSLFDSVFLSET